LDSCFLSSNKSRNKFLESPVFLQAIFFANVFTFDGDNSVRHSLQTLPQIS